jgi:hypothetical protein
MDEDNNDMYIGSNLFDIQCAIGALKPFAATNKAQIILDCLTALLKTLNDSDFEGEGTHEQNME